MQRLSPDNFWANENILTKLFPGDLMNFGPQTKTTLDGQGRARGEAARRIKSEWKVNLGIRNSTRSNGSW